MKTLMTLATLFIATQSAYALKASATLKDDTLIIAALTDDCNKYSSLMNIKETCSNTGPTRQCDRVTKVDIKILPKTRKRCFDQEVRIFKFDLGDHYFGGNIALSVNGEQFSLSDDSADEPAPVLTYRCVERRHVDMRCRKLGGCVSIKVQLRNDEGLVKSYTKGPLADRREQCQADKASFEN